MNPLLKMQMNPFYAVKLPSNGIPYKFMNGGHPAFADGALEKGGIVQVKGCTTKDELLWTDPQLVRTFRAPLQVLANTVQGLVNPGELLRVDAEYLLLWTRVFTYGEFTNMSWSCTKCDHENTTEVNFTKLSVKELKVIDDAILEVEGGIKVTMFPLTFQEAIEIQQVSTDDIEKQLDEVIGSIFSVTIPGETPEDEVTIVNNKQFIAEWIEQLNPKTFRHIMDHFMKINQLGVSTIQEVTCTNCGHREQTDVVIDVANFFSAEDSKQ